VFQSTAARKAVEAVAMEAAMVALCAIWYDMAMVSLEAVAKEATKVTVGELHEGIVVHDAEAQIYIDDVAAEEARASEEHYERRRVEDLAESRVKVEAALAAAEAECVTAAEVAEREAAE
jgi:hypothetical protein